MQASKTLLFWYSCLQKFQYTCSASQCFLFPFSLDLSISSILSLAVNLSSILSYYLIELSGKPVRYLFVLQGV